MPKHQVADKEAVSLSTALEARSQGITAIVKNLPYLIEAAKDGSIRYEARVPACTALALSIDALTNFIDSQYD